MARRGITVYTDEHVDANLAGELRRRGYDAVSCHESGRANQGISDVAQLAYAAEHGRAILTNNVRDYIPLDAHWKRQGQMHAGIITYAGVPSIGELLRRVIAHLDVTEFDAQYGTVLWLAS